MVVLVFHNILFLLQPSVRKLIVLTNASLKVAIKFVTNFIKVLDKSKYFRVKLFWLTFEYKVDHQ